MYSMTSSTCSRSSSRLNPVAQSSASLTMASIESWKVCAGQTCIGLISMGIWLPDQSNGSSNQQTQGLPKNTPTSGADHPREPGCADRLGLNTNTSATSSCSVEQFKVPSSENVEVQLAGRKLRLQLFRLLSALRLSHQGPRPIRVGKLGGHAPSYRGECSARSLSIVSSSPP